MTAAPELLDGPFVRVPPNRGNILVPVATRAAALAGLALYAPCRARTLSLHHAAWGLVATLGARALRAPRVPWVPPMGLSTWERLDAAWRLALGPFDRMAVYERPQASRAGLSVLLLRDDRPHAFVKLRAGVGALTASVEALAALERAPSHHVRTPAVLDHGEVAGWAWCALSPIPSRPHRPPGRPPLAGIAEDLADRLTSVVERHDAPAHWAPMHGDLTPWNLRRVIGRGLWLLDWEEVGWGPPGADEVYYTAASAALSGRTPPSTEHTEAASFWLVRVASRPSRDFDRSLNAVLGRTLVAMGGRVDLTTEVDVDLWESAPDVLPDQAG